MDPELRAAWRRFLTAPNDLEAAAAWVAVERVANAQRVDTVRVVGHVKPPPAQEAHP